jgi:hypothetical protein
VSEEISLRDYFERVLEEREKRTAVLVSSYEDALTLAARSMEQRLDKLNELRQEVITDRGNYVSRDKYSADIGLINERVATLTSKLDRAEGALFIARFLGASGIAALSIEMARLAGALR